MNWNVTTRHPAITVRSGKAAFAAEYEIPAATYRLRTPAAIGERIGRIAFTTAPRSTLLIRAIVGAVFLLEGCLKFVDPQGLGVGRFVKIGIPFPAFFAPFDGIFEITCGITLMLGLLTRVAAIPMIVNMIVAITTTKIPLLLHDGFWKAAHEARLDVTMLLGCLFLLLVGAGPMSLDSLLLASPRRTRWGFDRMDDEL